MSYINSVKCDVCGKTYACESEGWTIRPLLSDFDRSFCDDDPIHLCSDECFLRYSDDIRAGIERE